MLNVPLALALFVNMNTIVWSQTRCTYCEQAKALLDSHGIEYEERLIGDGSVYTKQHLLEAVPTARSVPQIFLKGEYVGGFTELRQKLTQEKHESNS